MFYVSVLFAFSHSLVLLSSINRFLSITLDSTLIYSLAQITSHFMNFFDHCTFQLFENFREEIYFFNFLFLKQIFQLFTAFYSLFSLLSLLSKQISDGRRLCVPQRYENRSIWFLCKRFTQKYAMDIIQSHYITFSSSQT